MRRAAGIAAVALALVAAARAPAFAAAAAAPGADRLYVIAVGYNGVPAGVAPDDDELRALRFADDDAAEIYALYAEAVDAGALLAALDAETARRHPELVAVARPPTLAELRRVVRETAARVDRDRRSGGTPAVVFFYSGHGFAGAEGPALAMQDGALGTRILYDEVIAPLAAAQVHVVVDACHAEAVVRPRDLRAPIVDVSAAQADAYVRKTTLARFPGVGAIVATTRGARAHEWDVYGSGIFTHELVSGLRGGADVNGDGKIEYSEIAAFLSAANRDVADPRARLEPVIRTPEARPRAPLIDLGRFARAGRLRARPAALGRLYVEDERGVRLLDLHAERGFTVTLVVPAGRPLFVRARDGEREITVAAGEVATLDASAFRPPALVARGAIESQLRRGLFAASFGPAYYLGYVESAAVPGVTVPVPVAPPPGDDVAPLLAARPAPRRTSAWLCLGAAAALGVGAIGVGAAAASSYGEAQGTTLERPAADARARFVGRRNLALAFGAAGGAFGIAGVVLWRLPPAAISVDVTSDGGARLALTGRLP